MRCIFSSGFYEAITYFSRDTLGFKNLLNWPGGLCMVGSGFGVKYLSSFLIIYKLMLFDKKQLIPLSLSMDLL